MVDLSDPSAGERWPALRSARGLEGVLGPGDALFLPRYHWHYVEQVQAPVTRFGAALLRLLRPLLDAAARCHCSMPVLDGSALRSAPHLPPPLLGLHRWTAAKTSP